MALPNPLQKHRGWLIAAGAVSTGAVLVLTLPAPAQARAAITVDTTSDVVDFGDDQTVDDLPGPDGQTTLPEAIIAANNTGGPDPIGFAIPTTDPGFNGAKFVIDFAPSSEADQLTLTDDNTTIDATTQPGGYPITVSGTAQTKTDEHVGLLIDSSGNTVTGLGWQLYGSAIRITGTPDTTNTDNTITAVTVHDCNNGVQFHNGDNTLTDSTITGNDRSPVTVVNGLGATISGNTITDNALAGVFIMSSPDVHVVDNLISRNQTGITVTSVDDAGGSAIGNTITENTADGVEIGSSGFTISRNSIAGNGRLGIDLWTARNDEFGVSKNTKDGPNYPEKLHAVDTGETTVVEGRIDYAAPQTVTIELFVNDVADPSGHGEGQTFLGTATADNKGWFTATLPGGHTGQYMTATATSDSGTTSEFSEAAPVTPAKH